MDKGKVRKYLSMCCLIVGDRTSFISRTSKHSGAIKAIQFNPFRSELLATAGAKGEVWTLNW